ncbi:MAG TPA: glycosyltransferase family A protein [Streptomyces sp.]|nr:glycosyltransferase family A protein [Streptomyces sp.]
MRVDVVTAAHAGYAGYVPAAWRSLRAQTHRDWRWFVQLDGPDTARLRAALTACGAASDPRVHIAAHRTSAGPAVTCNLALGRSSAPLIQNLDADDELERTALADLSRALHAAPDIGYAAGRARDLLPGGRLRDHPLPLTGGRLARGALLEHWRTDPGCYRLPLHPAGLMWHRELLLHVGGWSAMHGMEDTGTLMAASACAAGVLLDTPTLRYRRHPAQISRSTTKFVGGGVQVALIRQRALRLLTAPAWSAPPDAAGPPAGPW